MTDKSLKAELQRQPIHQALTVGEVAERSGVAVSTLHFYEAQGLISSWRNSGNQRRYAREVLRRVAVIKVAQRTGIPLAEIREALATLPEKRTPTAADWKKLSAPVANATQRSDRAIDSITRPVGWLHWLRLPVAGILSIAEPLGSSGSRRSWTAVAGSGDVLSEVSRPFANRG